MHYYDVVTVNLWHLNQFIIFSSTLDKIKYDLCYLPRHILGPWPQGREVNAWIVGSLSSDPRIQRSGRNTSGSGNNPGSRPMP